VLVSVSALVVPCRWALPALRSLGPCPSSCFRRISIGSGMVMICAATDIWGDELVG
jgi:hypothetical protein